MDRDRYRCRRDAEEQFKDDGAAHVFSTFYVEEEGYPLEIVDVDVYQGHRSRDRNFILDSTMDDERAAELLTHLPGKTSRALSG